MTATDRTTRFPTFLPRLAAVCVLLLGIAAAAAEGFSAYAGWQSAGSPSLKDPASYVRFAPAAETLAVTVALAAALLGLARLGRAIVGGRESADAADRSLEIAAALGELSDVVASLRRSTDQATSRAEAVALEPPPIPLEASDDPAPLNPALERTLERVVRLLDEIKDVSMLDESERTARRLLAADRKKTLRLDEARDRRLAGDDAQADALLHLLESLHPGDPDVLAERNALDDARRAEEMRVLAGVRAEVISHQQAGRHDAAVVVAVAAEERFPRLAAAGELANEARRGADEAEAAAQSELQRRDAEMRAMLRREAERLEGDRREAERLEGERLEGERLEAEHAEAERLEAQRRDEVRQEQDRLNAERIEAERVGAERVRAEQIAAEREAELSRQSAAAPSMAADDDETAAEPPDAAEPSSTDDSSETNAEPAEVDLAAIQEPVAQRLFDEIRQEVDRRHWRAALGCVQRLFDNAPQSTLAQRVRSQLPTIQRNAEIEERREREAAIHDLVRQNRYVEAIAFSEDLIRRFPSSPQARTLGEALPRLRDLAAKRRARTPSPASPFSD